MSLGLTNEGIAKNHPTRRRISCAAMGPGDIGSDARLDLSKSWRASVSRSEWGYAWFSTGGCLEEEIGRQGRYVIRDGSPVLLSFTRDGFTDAMAC